jgi:hypothetical protein
MAMEAIKLGRGERVQNRFCNPDSRFFNPIFLAIVLPSPERHRSGISHPH